MNQMPPQSNSFDPNSDDQNFKPQSRSPAEWVTFGIASLILASIAGLVVYVWVGHQDQAPPDIVVSQNDKIRESSGQFYVPFSVENIGGGTAESVQIMAELKINGQVEESSDQNIDFLSGGETEEGAFIFSRNPDDGELTLRVTGYKLP